MNKITLTFFIVLVILLIGGAFFLFFNNIDKQKDVNIAETNISKNKTSLIDLKNGFTLRLIDGWVSGRSSSNTINIFKFGSPAEIFVFYPYNRQNKFDSPAITITTFTIDDRLSAKDVVNLLHDKKIANKIESGTNLCYFKSSISGLKGIDYYAFKQDSTDLTKCKNPAAETGIAETVVLKNKGDKNVLTIQLTVSNSLEYDEYYSSLIDFIKELSYQGIKISFSN